VVGKMLIGYPPLAQICVCPFTYHASLRPQAHREQGYSPECVEGLFSEVRMQHPA
jgi:hypothetical protein